MLVIGKSGCGKTKFIESIIPHFSDSVETVVIATIIQNVPLHKQIIQYCKENGKKGGISFSPVELSTYVDRSAELGNVNMNRQGLMIFDDFNDGRKTGAYWDFTIHAFTKLRNLGWNFIIISQYPSFIPPIIRNNSTCRVLFECYSDSANRTFMNDIKARVHDQEVLHNLTSYLQVVPYTYMLVQDRPFTISAGKLDKAKPIVEQGHTVIPNYQEILRELHVDSREELDKKTAYLQAKAGNTAHQLEIPFAPYSLIPDKYRRTPGYSDDDVNDL